MVAKEFPDVAEETVPTAIELLDAESERLRANAAGVIADVAGPYPDQVRPAVSRAIALLDDEDPKVRHNATSILARVANVDPESVSPATAKLIDCLDDPLPSTRANACWALGYIEAEQALGPIEQVAERSSETEVQTAAEFALDQINK
jgi:HEAT repeat protein